MNNKRLEAADDLIRLADETQAMRKNLGSGRKVRWPDEIKQRTLGISDSGIPLSQIAFATGISIGSLMQWRDRRKQECSAFLLAGLPDAVL